MIPPPLSDDDVRQRLQTHPDIWVGELLGIVGDSLDECTDEELQNSDVLLDCYHFEWKRAWRYGLAEDAQEQILRRLGAWDNPEEKLRERYLHATDLSPLWNEIAEMCDTDELYAWGITSRAGKHEQRQDKVTLIPFIASIVCLILAVVTGETWWTVGWISLVVLGMILTKLHTPRNGDGDRHIDPEVTFRDIATLVHQTAQNRGEAMLNTARGGPSR